MASIQLDTISPFDAGYAQTITFRYSGTQCVKNRLTIKNSVTGSTVFDDEQVSYALSHTIPAGTLVNGTYYSCTVTAYWLNNGSYESITSSAVGFRCLTTPVWYFNNITDGTTLSDEDTDVQLVYSQQEGELLNEYEVIVYSTALAEIYNTGALYDSSLSVTLHGLSDGESYYLRGLGMTVGGMSIDTGYISVIVHYEESFNGSTLKLVNNSDRGCIEIISNIASSGGTPISDIVYLSNDTEADLRYVPVDFSGSFTAKDPFEIHAFVRAPAEAERNLLPSVYAREAQSGTTCTLSGITWTVNDDGSVTANGTSTGDVSYRLSEMYLDREVSCVSLDPDKSYTLSGCPDNGSFSTYCLRVKAADTKEDIDNGNGTFYTETGNGVTLTGHHYAYVYIRIASGVTVSNLTFYPMFEIGTRASAYQSTHTSASDGIVRPLLNTPLLILESDDDVQYEIYFRSNSDETPRYLWAEVRQDVCDTVTAQYLSSKIAYPGEDTRLYLYVAKYDGRFDVSLEVVT